jgi:DNA repair exonuclease SbcCD ATPase subunit
MFVNFELDETFNETIKSRNRDIFSYNSFSEGERCRLDLGILFAWRKIAMAKNSVSTNLLVFDEILDKSLDTEGIATFLDIMSTLEEETNVIVISHRENLPEVFDRNIRIKKVNDFSLIEET